MLIRTISLSFLVSKTAFSVSIPKQWISTGNDPDDGCWLIPQERDDIEAQTSRIVSTKWGDGLNAVDGGAVRHGSCLNECQSLEI